MFLDPRNCLIAFEILFEGSLTQTAVHPREVVRRALQVNAGAVILAHNLLRQMGLEAGQPVAITSDGQTVTIAPTRRRYSLAEMLKGMKAGDMPTAPGWDADKPKGREAW